MNLPNKISMIRIFIIPIIVIIYYIVPETIPVGYNFNLCINILSYYFKIEVIFYKLIIYTRCNFKYSIIFPLR